jgi:hypothetical protein
MRFAQFYHESTGWNGRDFSGPVRLIEACGSDGVAIFDGRFSLSRCVQEARDYAAKMNRPDGLNKKFKGFTIEAGERFTTSRTVRALELL